MEIVCLKSLLYILNYLPSINWDVKQPMEKGTQKIEEYLKNILKFYGYPLKEKQRFSKKKIEN